MVINSVSWQHFAIEIQGDGYTEGEGESNEEVKRENEYREINEKLSTINTAQICHCHKTNMPA